MVHFSLTQPPKYRWNFLKNIEIQTKNYSFKLARWKIYWNVKASAKGGPIPVQNISLPFFIFFGAIGAILVPFLTQKTKIVRMAKRKTSIKWEVFKRI